MTNSRAILIGGRDTTIPPDGQEDKTYIDVLAFNMNTLPPTVSCLSHWEKGSDTPISLRAGLVNDVELTPDEAFAIVNSQNWIHVIDLSTGGIAAEFNIGSSPWAGPCSPGFAADSVAATNDTAIVATTRLTPSPNVRSRAWVYLIDLLSNDPPEIVLEHELSGTSDLDPRDFDPHDVVITPNGSYSIVTASDGLAVYDLTQHLFLARHLAPTQGFGNRRLRFFSDIVDSVETTNTRFVAIATDFHFFVNQPVYGTYESRLWTADVFEVPPTSGPNMTPLHSYELRADTTFVNGAPHYQGSPMVNDTPHDLAVDDEAEMAVFRTSRFNVVLTDLDDPDPQDIVRIFPSNGISNIGSPTFVSDSVLIAPQFVQHVPQGGGTSGLKRYALTLGVCGNCGPNAQQQGRVDVIDLNLNPPALVHTFGVHDPTGNSSIVPADLRLGPTPMHVMVRFDADPDDTPPMTGGRDVVRFALYTLSEVARIGGSGGVFAVDSLEVGRTRTTSVAEDLSQGSGFVHFVQAQ